MVRRFHRKISICKIVLICECTNIRKFPKKYIHLPELLNTPRVLLINKFSTRLNFQMSNGWIEMNCIKNRCRSNRIAVTLWSSFKNTFKVLCSPPPFLNPLPSIVSLRAEKLLLLPSNKPLEIPKETTETIDYLSSWCMCVLVCLGEDGWVQRVCVESETLRKSDMQVRKCAFVWMALQFEHLEGPCCCSKNVW